MAPKQAITDPAHLRLPDRASAMRFLLRNQTYGDGRTAQFSDAWKQLSGRLMTLFGEESEIERR